MAEPLMEDIIAAVRQRFEQEGVTTDEEAAEQFRALAQQWVEAATRDRPGVSEEELLRIGEHDVLLRQRSDKIWSALARRTLIRFFDEELDKRIADGTLTFGFGAYRTPDSARRRTV